MISVGIALNINNGAARGDATYTILPEFLRFHGSDSRPFGLSLGTSLNSATTSVFISAMGGDLG